MRRIIMDAEFNGLNPTRIWCIVTKDLDSEGFSVFTKDNFNSFIELAKTVDQFIGHNIISFDSYHINNLLGEEVIDPLSCLDTLVLSRLIHYNRPGGHSVEAWGKSLGLVKTSVGKEEWFDENNLPLYIERCKQDVLIQEKIYEALKRFVDDPSWKRAIDIEHKIQLICREMELNGFPFDVDEANRLLEEINNDMKHLEERIAKTAPPIITYDRTVTLKRNKNGEPSYHTKRYIGKDTSFKDGSEFYLVSIEKFNPGSVKHRLILLNKAGWKPTEKTAGHLDALRKIKRVPKGSKKYRELKERLEHFRVFGWKVNEENLRTLPESAPEAVKLLSEWLTLEGRKGDLTEWLSAVQRDSKIHGRFNGIGSWTHRMSHANPNQANIYSDFILEHCKDPNAPTPVERIKLKYNGRLRALWRSSPGFLLVGTDASGIQLRALAHYIGNEGYIRAVVSGKKEDGTDIHTLNQKALGEICRSRDDAKTFIYAWLLGAQVDKVSEILGCSREEARTAIENFLDAIPGLRQLKEETIPRIARQKYFVGLDGRKVIVPEERKVLAGLLQNFEACVMKAANLAWVHWAKQDGIWFRQIDFVHDEWVTEVKTEEDGKRLGELQILAIKRVGKEFGSLCPLDGESKIGYNWLEVH